ncbi:MAG: hypothetical protein ACYCQJ_12585 [Nitrososphaerales archaeon]
MTISSCLYGTDTNSIDVTTKVTCELKSNNYIHVSNKHFGDPCIGIRKNLFIKLENGSTMIVKENDYFIDPNTIKHYKLIIYYHIFATSGQNILDIFNEQIQTIQSSPYYDNIELIQCCLSGNDIENYDIISQKLEQLHESTGKFNIRKREFDDKTYELFTYNAMKEDILTYDHTDNQLKNIFIAYIHSKGVNASGIGIPYWRRCMQYFLITKAEHTINQMIVRNAETSGCFLTEASPNIPKHYSGNFWIARGPFLHRIFSRHQFNRSDPSFNRYNSNSNYYAGEFYFSKEPHRWHDLFNVSPKFQNKYIHIIEPKTYMF